ncbi:hypothetical protein BXZ70DRAFT_646180 [Cristinia sonorae]|uniref:Uncharacterized protein n=1 Tax=Cristinia sonorae TaxID=1940300 RepID=A0A8K0UDZ6_9AGAR|nr:hypothetical protein BXZ70DRAFT_646180 [Cristinia sonorae]
MQFSFLLVLAALFSFSLASPLIERAVVTLEKRTTAPVFPNDPPSCPICEQNYPNINSCAEAAPVLANVSMIIFNPGAFIDVIKCACTDTFQSAFPQCVDCFTKTGQTDVLSTPDLPSIVSGMRSICALESTLLGNVSNTNGETTPVTAPPPAPTNDAASDRIVGFTFAAFVLLASFTVNVL